MRKIFIIGAVAALLAPISFANPPLEIRSNYRFSRPNIFGGHTYYSEKGSVTSIPNNQGGHNYYGQFRGFSRKNAFGGETFYRSRVRTK